MSLKIHLFFKPNKLDDSSECWSTQKVASFRKRRVKKPILHHDMRLELG